MKEIPLTRGKVAIVDDEDFESLSQFPWYAAPDQNGYVYATRNLPPSGTRKHQRPMKMHRQLMGAGPGDIIDHINGDTLDNRRANLRHATKAENCHNSLSRSGRSRFKGVTGTEGRWRARVAIDNYRRHLGYFVTEEEAAMAYDAAARVAHGAFARLNFPMEGERAAIPEGTAARGVSEEETTPR